MWSHYSDYHKGVCLEFKISDILSDVHPCFYTKDMPAVNWQSDCLSLTLIKASPWGYENEWRYIKRSVRTVMRMFGSVTHDIYNAIQADKKYSASDHEEWSTTHSALQLELEEIYNLERTVQIKPTRIFLGVKFYNNYGNTSTL
jgi:hypothetical protein